VSGLERFSGDSTANSLGWVLRTVHRPDIVVHLQGQDGCTMLSDSCKGADWAAYTRDLKPEVTLVFLGGAFLHGLPDQGKFRKACHPIWDRPFVDTLSKRLRELQSPAGRAYVLTVPYPLGPWELPEMRKEVDCINESIREAVRGAPAVELIDVAGHLCPNGVCERESSGVPIRPDGVHYSVDGGNALGRWLITRVSPAVLANAPVR